MINRKGWPALKASGFGKKSFLDKQIGLTFLICIHSCKKDEIHCKNHPRQFSQYFDVKVSKIERLSVFNIFRNGVSRLRRVDLLDYRWIFLGWRLSLN